MVSGDGVFSHICIGSGDLSTSAKFYDASLAPLGLKMLGGVEANALLYGRDRPALLILRPINGEAPSSNGMTIGFCAESTVAVDAFHAAGLAAGGLSEGEPGPRNHLPGAYAAYLRDPSGNKICAYNFPAR